MQLLERQQVNAMLLVDRFDTHPTLGHRRHLAGRHDETMSPRIDLVPSLSLARLRVRLIVVRGWQQRLEVFQVVEHGRLLLIARRALVRCSAFRR